MFPNWLRRNQTADTRIFNSLHSHCSLLLTPSGRKLLGETDQLFGFLLMAPLDSKYTLKFNPKKI